jgi:hypothetical protein
LEFTYLENRKSYQHDFFIEVLSSVLTCINFMKFRYGFQSLNIFSFIIIICIDFVLDLDGVDRKNQLFNAISYFYQIF